MNKYVKIVVVLWVVAMVALAAGTVALADDPARPGAFGWFGKLPGAARMGGYFEQVREAVASKLGVTVDELAEATQAASQEAIEQALADGEITQEQADCLLSGEHMESPGYGSFGRHMGWGGVGVEAHHATLANVLGMTVEELEAELAAGKTLRDLMEELDVDMDDVWDAMHGTRDATRQRALKEGCLTPQHEGWIFGQGGRGAGRSGGGCFAGTTPRLETQ